MVKAGDTNVYMDATTNPATEHFRAGCEACGFWGGHGRQRTSAPRSNRPGTGWTPSWSTSCFCRGPCICVWARGMAHPCVQTSTTQAGRCWNTWRGTWCTPPPPWTTRSRPPTSSKGGQRGHAPYARRPPPEAAGHAEGEQEAPRPPPGASGAPQKGSIPPGLAPLAPLWAALGRCSPHPMAPAHPGDLAAPADPAAMPMRDS